MNHQDKSDLRDLRDQIEDPDDKKLLRKVINYITLLEQRLFTIRVHARAILNEVNNKGGDASGSDGEGN